jgi:hypothetical protein
MFLQAALATFFAASVTVKLYWRKLRVRIFAAAPALPSADDPSDPPRA